MDETITIYVGKINENGYVRTFKCKKSSVSGPYFDMLIKNSKNRTLRLPSILPEAFKYVVDTLDRPRASLVFETLEDALITYSMCDMMLLTRSKDMCLQDVKRKLFDVDNALRILNINAMTINDEHISNLAWRKIRFRPNDILKSPLLKELETEDFLALILEVASIAKPNLLVEACINFVQDEGDVTFTREQFMNQVFPKVPWDLMNAYSLHAVMGAPFLEPEDKISIVMN